MILIPQYYTKTEYKSYIFNSIGAKRLRESMQIVSNHIKDLVGITEKGKVVPFPRAKGE